MKFIENLLRREIGLDAASIGSSMVERAARLRMKALRLEKCDDYRRLLESSPEECLAFIETIVVNETWFFRDPPSFAALAQLVLQNMLRPAIVPFRILSVPCSSGEEPYSLVMTLLDSGVLPERFTVEAVDISARMIERARRAVFGKNSFRGGDLAFRDRHFQAADGDYRLKPRIAGGVQFFRDNLLDERFLTGHAPYDYVFCRNLLIYFDRPTQLKALAKLEQLLTPNGVLFVGPAEISIFLDQGFVPVDLPMAFACRKPIENGSPGTARVARARPPVSSMPVATGAGLKGKSLKIDGPVKLEIDLASAQKLADAGQLKRAGEICEANLRIEGPSARAYYLLGLIHDSAGDGQAMDFYRKALYLDPKHFEALWHMAVLAERNGDAAGARAFKRRALRAQPKDAVKT